MISKSTSKGIHYPMDYAISDISACMPSTFNSKLVHRFTGEVFLNTVTWYPNISRPIEYTSFYTIQRLMRDPINFQFTNIKITKYSRVIAERKQHRTYYSSQYITEKSKQHSKSTKKLNKIKKSSLTRQAQRNNTIE